MKIAVSSGKSLNFFVRCCLIANAISIGLSALKTGSAASQVPPFETNICSPGDIYEVEGFETCFLAGSEWCRNECKMMGRSPMVKEGCVPYVGKEGMGKGCLCCCKDFRPPIPPTSSPSPLPPTRTNSENAVCTAR